MDYIRTMPGPSEISLRHVALFCGDLEAMERFYVDVLGMTQRNDRPDFSFDGAWLQSGDQQVHLLLIYQSVGVCDALVGFALVVEQRQFDRVAIDAAGGIDRFKLVGDHLALFFAIVGDHA